MMDVIFNVIMLACVMALGGCIFVAVMMFVFNAIGFLDE